MQMRAHGIRGDGECGGDLSVRIATRDELQDLALALGERHIEGVGCPRLATGEGLLGHPLHDVDRHESALAFEHGRDGAVELLRRRAEMDDGVRAGGEGFDGTLLDFRGWSEVEPTIAGETNADAGQIGVFGASNNSGGIELAQAGRNERPQQRRTAGDVESVHRSPSDRVSVCIGYRLVVVDAERRGPGDALRSYWSTDVPPLLNRAPLLSALMATHALTLSVSQVARQSPLDRLNPGLTALVVYLRPAPRRLLLDAAARVGLFVVEHQGAKGVLEAARLVRADLAVVVRQPDEGLDVVKLLAEAFPRRLVVVHPPGAQREPNPVFLHAAVISDLDLEHDFGQIIGPAARAARLAREQAAATIRVFGELEFAPESRELRCGDRIQPLSRWEREVLGRLARTVGRPVSHEELERCCAESDEPVHPGLLKAVVLRLRRKAEALGADPQLLQTVRGFGYVLAG